MTSQNNIEQLQTTVKEVTTEVAEVKSLEDEILKKTRADAAVLKAETLLKQIATTKEAVNKKLESLKGKTDAQSLEEISQLQKEIAQLEEMLQTLESSETDLAELKNGITVTDTKTGVDNVQEKNDKEKLFLLTQEYKDQVMQKNNNKKTEKKSSDEKGWFKKQIDGFSDSTEENHTWKNVGRIAMGVGAGVLIYKGIKWLFGGGKKKEKKESKDGEGEEKGFWQKPFGKFLKRTGIGTGAYYLIHGVTTGRWGLKDFFDWDKKNTDNHDKPKDQVKSYKEFIEDHPEDAEKYEKFGESVDGLYENIFAKELEAGWQDDGDMETIAKSTGTKESLKGLVPFCMDNSFSSVDSILSEWGVGVDLIGQSNQEIKSKIGSLFKNPLGGALHLFLQALPSWAQFAKGKTTEEQAQAWLSNDTVDRIAELKMFFREQMRVTTFLKTKEGELLKIIAAKKYAQDPAGFDDVSDAIDDNDWFEKYITNDPEYQLFRSGKILGAYSILTKYGIMNTQLDEDTKTIVQECDEERDNVLLHNKEGSILDVCKNDIQDGSLENNNKEQLVKSCDKINDNIEKLEKVAEDRAMDMYRRLFNTDNANKEELLNNSTILPLLRGIRQSVPEMKAKIKSGNVNKEDIAALTLFINNYFALKKELEIGTQVYQMIKSDDGSTGLTYGTLLKDSIHNMRKGWHKFWKGEVVGGLARGVTGVVGFGLAAIPIAIIGGGYVAFKKGIGNGLRYVANIPIMPITKAYQASLRCAKTVNGKFVGPAGSLRKRFFGEIDGPEKLINELKEGDISLAKSRNIINNGTNMRGNKKLQTKRKTLSAPDEKLFNRKLLQKAFDGTTMTDPERDMLAKYFDKRGFNSIIINNSTEGMKLIKAYETKLSKLTANQRKIFDELSDYKKISFGDMEGLITHIDQIQIEGVWTEKEIQTLIKSIKKDMSVVHDINAFNTKIVESKKIVSTVNNVTEVLDQVKVTELHKLIDSEISTLKGKISPSTPNVRKNYYNETIEMLTELKGKTQLLTSGELDSLLRLSTNGFDVSNLAKLYKMSKVNVIGADMLEEALQKGDINDIVRVLDIARNDASYTKIIKKGDIDEVITTLKKIDPKVIAECGSDIANVCKKAVKLFTKLT